MAHHKNPATDVGDPAVVIADLRAQLSREQARGAALEKRAALFEEAAKRAYRLAAGVLPARTDPRSTEG